MKVTVDVKAERERIAKLMTEAGRRMLDRAARDCRYPTDPEIVDLLRPGMDQAAAALTPGDLAYLSAFTDDEVIAHVLALIEPDFRRSIAEELPS